MGIPAVYKDNPYLISILLIAFLIRFVGIFHDLPYSYYPDEDHFVNRSVSFGSGDFNPYWFHKPAFLMYLLFFEYGLYFVIGKVIGTFSSIDDFAFSFFNNKAPFLLIGRITVALFGVATIFITYLIGREHFNRRTGILSALFLAFTVGHVSSGQVVKADVPAAFFTMLSFYFISKIYSAGRLKYYVFAGVFAGLGMATKYYSVVLIPTIFLAHIFYLRRVNLPVFRKFLNKESITATISFLLTFFVSAPYNILDPLGFEQTILNKLRKFMYVLFDRGGSEFNGVDTERFVLIRSIGDYISVLISSDAMGTIGIIALIGVVLLIIRLSPQNTLLLSFPILFIIIANHQNPFYSEPRHLSVIYPFMALSAACFISFLFERLQRNHRTHPYPPIGEGMDGWKVSGLIAMASIIILTLPVYYIVQHDYLMIKPNTRTLAKEWIESNVPIGTKMLLEEEVIRISPDIKYYKEMLSRIKDVEKGQFTTHAEKIYSYSLMALPDITYDLSFIRIPWWQERETEPGVYYATSDHDKDFGNPLKPVGVMSYEYYKENGYEYAIVSSEELHGHRFKEGSDRARNFPSFYNFYKTLFEKGTLIKEFRPDPWKSRGPVIKIFSFK